MAAAPGFCRSRLQRSGSSRVPPPAVALALPSEGGGSGSGPAGGDPVPGFGRDRPGKLPKLGSERWVAARPSCGPAGAWWKQHGRPPLPDTGTSRRGEGAARLSRAEARRLPGRRSGGPGPEASGAAPAERFGAALARGFVRAPRCQVAAAAQSEGGPDGREVLSRSGAAGPAARPRAAAGASARGPRRSSAGERPAAGRGGCQRGRAFVSGKERLASTKRTENKPWAAPRMARAGGGAVGRGGAPEGCEAAGRLCARGAHGLCPMFWRTGGALATEVPVRKACHLDSATCVPWGRFGVLALVP